MDTQAVHGVGLGVCEGYMKIKCVIDSISCLSVCYLKA
jgi:hypothetical protein